MASKQQLKKEIDYMVSDLVIDCFTVIGMKQNPNNDEIMKIIEKTLILRNELRTLANHPENKETSQSTKSYYNHIIKTLVEDVSASYQKVSELIKSE
jgi:hypothetical protein